MTIRQDGSLRGANGPALTGPIGAPSPAMCWALGNAEVRSGAGWAIDQD
jgi:hypothetical protein